MGKAGCEQAYRQVLGEHGEATDVKLAESAVCPGVALGPEARERQWGSAIAKARSWVAHVASAPSLMSRILGSNMHFASLCAFKGQFAEVHAPVRNVYSWAVRKVVRAPWQAFPAILLTSSRVLNLALEVRELAALSAAAPWGWFDAHRSWELRGRVWEAEWEDGACLNLHRVVHGGSAFGLFCQRQDWLESLPPEPRATCATGTAKAVVAHFRGPTEAREAAIRAHTVLARRVRRRGPDAADTVGGFMRFGADSTPI